MKHIVLSPHTQETLQAVISYFFDELDAEDFRRGAGDELIRASRELGFLPAGSPNAPETRREVLGRSFD